MRWIIIIPLLFICGCSVFQPVHSQPIEDNREVEDIIIQKSVSWLIPVGIVALGLSVIATVNGSKLGIGAIVASTITIVAALAIIKYGAWIAIAAIVLAVGAVVLSIFNEKQGFFNIFQLMEKKDV